MDTAVRRALDEAAEIVRSFAAEHHLPVGLNPLPVKEAVLFATQGEFIESLMSRAGTTTREELGTAANSGGAAAAIDDATLLIITPDEYQRVRPEYTQQEDAFVRLIAHELAHSFHLQLVGGDPDKMGPEWFYEGLAAVIAGQLLGPSLEYSSAEEALENAAHPGRLRYASFSATVRYFAGQHSIPLLIENAAKPGFEGWLLACDCEKNAQRAPGGTAE